MKKTTIFLVIISLAICGGTKMAHGSGFLIYTHGAAAMALGGAFISIADNPTAMWYNPAGIAWLRGTQISLGTTFIIPNSTLEFVRHPTVTSVDQESQLFYPSSVYLTQEICDRITVGFGFYSPFGLGSEWPEDYPLKYISTKSDMKTFFFNPNLAVLISKRFSIAIGVSYIHSTIAFNLVEKENLDIGPLFPLFNFPAPPGPVMATVEAPVALEADGNAWSLNVGALYKAECFSIGFKWRSAFKIRYDGDLMLGTPAEDISPPYDQLVPPGTISGIIPSEGSASTEFSFPHILGAGISLNLSRNWMFAFDVNFILWNSFDQYVVDVDAPLLVDAGDAGFSDKEVIQNWENSWILRAGLQYMASDALALRAGILYDETPQPVSTMDPAIPDADRWAFTAGLGYRTGRFVIDLAYQCELFDERSSLNRNALIDPFLGNLGEGTYSTRAHLFGISVGYLF